MTVGTGLRYRVDCAVIEISTQAEAVGGMTDAAVDRHRGVSLGLARGRSAVVAGNTGSADNIRTLVVGECPVETVGAVAGTAFALGLDVILMLSDRHDSVVTGIAGSQDTAVIEASIGLEFEEMIGVVAVVAGCLCRYMKIGFTDRLHAIVALRAFTEYLGMIHVRNTVESQRCVANLAGIARGEVIGRLAENAGKTVVVTVAACRRQARMIEWAGGRVRWYRRDHLLNRALTLGRPGPDSQLDHVGARSIGHE